MVYQWWSNFIGSVSYRLLRLVFNDDDGYFVVSWFAAKFDCMDILDGQALMARVNKSKEQLTKQAIENGWTKAKQ